MCGNDVLIVGAAYTAGYATLPQLSLPSTPKHPFN